MHRYSRVHGVKENLQVKVRWELLEVDAPYKLPGERHQPFQVVHIGYGWVKSR